VERGEGKNRIRTSENQWRMNRGGKGSRLDGAARMDRSSVREENTVVLGGV
jgi:hypothetical protein